MHQTINPNAGMKHIIFWIFAAISICKGQDTLFVGEANYFSGIGSEHSYAISPMSPDRIVVTYKNDSPWDGRVRVGEIDEDCGIMWGEPVEFTYLPLSSVERLRVEKISDSTFLIAFNSTDFDGGLVLRVGEIQNGNQIALGEPFLLAPDQFYSFSIRAIENNKVLVAYHDYVTYRGKCSLVTISPDLSVTLESDLFFTPATSNFGNDNFVSVDVLSNSKFILAYGYDRGDCIIGTIEENQIVGLSEPFEFKSLGSFGNALDLRVLVMTESSFVLNYIEYSSGNSYNGVSRIGTINQEEEISFSEAFIFGTEKVFGLETERLSESSYLITYVNFITDEGSLLSATVANDEVTFSPESIVNTNSIINAHNPIAILSDQLYAILYVEEPSSGYVVLSSDTELSSCLTTSNKNPIAPVLKLFPNPTDTHLNLVLASDLPYDLSLFDAKGTNVMSRSGNRGSVSLDVSGLSIGVYTLILTSDAGHVVRKVVVQ